MENTNTNLTEVKTMTVGERIHAVRKENKLSQIELADLAGVGSSMISKWESGVCDPRNDSIEKIAHALDVNFHWLLYGTGDKTVKETIQKIEKKRQETVYVYKASTARKLRDINIVIRNLRKIDASDEDKKSIHSTLSAIRNDLEAKVIFGERDE